MAQAEQANEKASSTHERANNATLFGVCLIALATLMIEILLTRIWSVTSWYHFAFVAISISMFGLTAGALSVLIFPRFFSGDQFAKRLTSFAMLFAIAASVCFITHLAIPFFPDKSLVGLYSVVLTYAIVAIPFVFSGICITLALNHYIRDLPAVYAADLFGAALGCLAVLAILKITDAPTAIIFTSCIASLASYLFARGLKVVELIKPSLMLLAVFTFVFAANTFAVAHQHSLLRPLWVKAQFEPRPVFEKWNTFSRVTVTGDPNTLMYPSGWGVSATFPAERRVRQVSVVLDAYYSTPITHYSGKDAEIEHLKYDVVNTANYLRHNADILVLGSGGGRDILSAFAFHQHKVVGVEINEDVLSLLTKKYAEFAGHIDQDPRVHLYIDEARSFVSRSKDKFDIIQISLIDTQSTTGAGAYALTENSLYTRQAWKLFLEHLKPHGILTCTRLYYKNAPGEVHRMVALARTALLDMGINNPERNIMVLGQFDNDSEIGLGVVLVSRDAFSPDDLAAARQFAALMKFQVLLAPLSEQSKNPNHSPDLGDHDLDKYLGQIAAGQTDAQFLKDFPIRLDAPTDDKPFFFYMLKPEDLLKPQSRTIGTSIQYTKAETVLTELLFAVTFLSIICIFLPLRWKASHVVGKAEIPLFVYFAALGLGFMFVEISQLQRLTIFLGHPAYSLSVVLFTLLLSSSMGSLAAGFLVAELGRRLRLTAEKLALMSTMTIIVVLIAYAYAMPYLLAAYAGADTPSRIMVAILGLFPLGFSLGFPMPLGLTSAHERCPSGIAWFWGINGAMSVWGSVAAVVIAINWGISATYMVGVVAYGLAGLAILASIKIAAARLSK